MFYAGVDSPLDTNIHTHTELETSLQLGKKLGRMGVPWFKGIALCAGYVLQPLLAKPWRPGGDRVLDWSGKGNTGRARGGDELVGRGCQGGDCRPWQQRIHWDGELLDVEGQNSAGKTEVVART